MIPQNDPVTVAEPTQQAIYKSDTELDRFTHSAPPLELIAMNEH
jgi:hypothetical protein